jgi:hypothetical protein
MSGSGSVRFSHQLKDRGLEVRGHAVPCGELMKRARYFGKAAKSDSTLSQM